MKFVAIIDEKSLTRQEMESLFFLGRDKNGKVFRIDLKPLTTHILTTKDGENVYLNQKHIDCLIEFEKSEIIQKLVGDMESGFRLLGRNNKNDE